MTLEEMKQQFPIGCVVRLAEMCFNDFDLSSSTHYEGDIGKVIGYENDMFLQVKWIKRRNTEFLSTNSYYPERFELVCYDSQAEIQQSENKTCPRCSKEMGKVQTDQYGLIDKCLNCGYC